MINFDKINLCDFKNLTIKRKKTIFPTLDFSQFRRKKSDKEDRTSFKNLYFIRRQKYFQEKKYYNATIKQVFSELEKSDSEITRLIFYDNCCFVQFTKRGFY